MQDENFLTKDIMTQFRVPAYNVSQCIHICTELYYVWGIECRAAAWNGEQKQCYLKSGKGNPTPKKNDVSFLLSDLES